MSFSIYSEHIISNPISDRLARVINADEENIDLLGLDWRDEVFVTAAEDVERLSAAEISHRLGHDVQLFQDEEMDEMISDVFSRAFQMHNAVEPEHIDEDARKQV